MKRILSLVFALVALLPLCAAPITRNAALQMAQQFAQEKGKALASEVYIAPGRKMSAARQPLYLFNMEDNNGFVIVAGDDRAIPILGYATQGSYNENDSPCNFRDWLDEMAREIDALPPSAEGGSMKAPRKVATHNAIAPLIKTQWNQGATTAEGYIYNTLCPTVDGRHCVTGCVATAGAQVMYYYQHPKDAIPGVPGYELEGYEHIDTSEPLPPTQFNWEDMKLTYSTTDQGTEAALAVAELMLYCGYAVRMGYGLNGSGSNTRAMAQGMIDYFDYDPYTFHYVARSDFSVCEWDELIYNELAEARPVLYRGSGTKSGGHAFICDGYDGKGLYHFNWGWGGNHDGYYTLHATNPYGDNVNNDGFISGQSACIGLQPNTGFVPEIVPQEDEREDEIPTEGLVPTLKNLRVDDTSIIYAGYNRNEENCAFGFGIAEENSDGTLVSLEERLYYQNNNLPTNYGYSTISFNLSNYNLTAGHHKIVPICNLKDENIWKRCKPTYMFFTADVEGGEMTIETHPLEKIKVDTFAVVSSRLPYTRQRVKVQVTNEGDFFDKYLAIYLGSEEDAGDYVSWVKAMIAPGNTKEYMMSADLWNSEEQHSDLTPGIYVLRLCQYGNPDVVYASTTMVIEQNLELMDIKLPGNRLIQNVQKVVAKIKNTTGDYTAPLYLFASQTDEPGAWVYRAGSALESGKVSDVEFYLAPEAEGEWNLWVATDTLANDIIGQKTVTFHSLDYESFEVTGCKVATVKQSVELTVANPGGDYAGIYYLFASMTEEKGSRKDSKNVVVAGGSSSSTTFYFTPSEAGTWNLWLCSDASGNKVVMQTSISIEEPPTGIVKLEYVSHETTYSWNTATVSITAKNTSETPSYKELYAFLKEGGETIGTASSLPVTIEPGGTGTTSLTFNNLEPGKTYTAKICYFYEIGVNVVYYLRNVELSLPVQPSTDLNGDYAVTQADMDVFIGVLAGRVTDEKVLERADVNGDGKTNIADVILLLKAMNKE